MTFAMFKQPDQLITLVKAWNWFNAELFTAQRGVVKVRVIRVQETQAHRKTKWLIQGHFVDQSGNELH